ncbi:PEP-CTERM sorting domain-containing protein [Desmonostoc muscorum LEGE 12446]|uniref:PEP-CTERM sorting domain-containing protein n=1 Tax=Desmonostoc muscorum LEGE 12446 TaxID=1828758 RepID=A0A8J7DHA1_DESMC|nr:PEP-CTERM sorting domain-containing protein [Desmonostoc muscorum]MCF2148175.1 PEP-CTERM sorting domain-containing protein [Desmonostoc muscorum LEGE 12446]
MKFLFRAKATTFTTIKISAAIVVGMILSSISVEKAYAADFKFIKIADTNDFGDFSVSASYPPAINDKGTVAFKVSNFSVSGSEVPFSGGIFTGSGGALTTIAPIGSFYFVNFPSINNSDTVAFYARTSSSGGDEILTSSGGTLTLIADTTTFSNLGFPTINDENTVAFRGERFPEFDGILTSSGGALTTIIDNTGSFISSGVPAINNSGTVAFTAGPDKVGGEGIFTVSDGTLNTIVDSSGPFQRFRNPGINDTGTVILSASLDAGGEGIFTVSDGILTPIVTSRGLFESFLDQPAINNEGAVAFVATLDAGGFGIFTGADPVADKVIAIGDSLFGSKITGLNFTFEGFNNRGEIAFAASFEDSTGGYFVAVPVASVPEPTNLLGLGTAMSLGVLFQGKLSKKPKNKGI